MAGAYTAACTSAGCRVLLTVTEAYSSKTKDLICSGNRTVELLDARMVDLDMAPLAVALEETNPFQTIDVSYNTLGAGAAESLRKLVAADSTITSLDLSQNDFNESACRALCEGLKQNRAIGSLNLSGNKLGGPGGMALADLLQTNSTLEALYASNCELDTAALIALATVLRDNTSLRVLDVSRPLAKTVMDEPANHFARMLKVNTTLHELDMSKSGLSDKGLQLLAESVYRAGPNSRLEVLKVKCNRITLVDADCVGALRLLLSSEVSRLQTLLLGANTLRDEGALKLAEVRTQRESGCLAHTTRLAFLTAHTPLFSLEFILLCALRWSPRASGSSTSTSPPARSPRAASAPSRARSSTASPPSSTRTQGCSTSRWTRWSCGATSSTRPRASRGSPRSTTSSSISPCRRWTARMRACDAECVFCVDSLVI